MRSFKRLPKMNRGFTLVELMIVVAIIGVLAALAIYGVSKYLATTKTSEAKNTLGAIKRSASVAFDSPRMAGALLTEGSTGTADTNSLCDSAENVPSGANPPKGVKYQPKSGASEDFNSGTATAGWRCLKFSMNQPHYYQYQYASNGVDFTAQARGDLDGDGVVSEFNIIGKVVSGQLKTADNVTVVDAANEFE
jgi:type IV pilus assembly protein PilA